ncbi:MAG: hypothetical protein BRD54_02425 [Bacteroidetes bacterium SW_8_64_56]|nr:MAG: hypothetical protein BRD54_02425 [Bacteroidetes bacterium SW_8_64_56]
MLRVEYAISKFQGKSLRAQPGDYFLASLGVLANPFLTEVQALTLHRSATHSLLFIALVTLGAAVGLRRLHRGSSVSAGRWGALVFAALLTHVGLDCLTTYGTQVFWPFSDYPVIYGTIFIIDPLYTIPLATGLLVSLRWAPTARRRRWANYAGLALSSAYLLWTVVNKQHVSQVFAGALDETALEYERVFTAPTPFNNLLWQGIAEADDGYYIGFYSLLDDDQSIDFRHVPKRHDLLGDARENPVFESRARSFANLGPEFRAKRRVCRLPKMQIPSNWTVSLLPEAVQN